MASASKDEQVQIKRDMSVDPALAAILTVLESSDKVETIEEGRLRRIKQRKANIEGQLKMEVDQPGVKTDVTQKVTTKVQMPSGT